MGSMQSSKNVSRLKSGYPMKGQDEVSSNPPATYGKIGAGIRKMRGTLERTPGQTRQATTDSQNIQERLRMERELGITRGNGIRN